MLRQEMDAIRAVDEAAGAMKTCSRCRVFQHVTHFYNDDTKPDGKYSMCRKCVKQGRKEWRKRGKEAE